MLLLNGAHCNRRGGDRCAPRGPEHVLANNSPGACFDLLHATSGVGTPLAGLTRPRGKHNQRGAVTRGSSCETRSRRPRDDVRFSIDSRAPAGPYSPDASLATSSSPSAATLRLCCSSCARKYVRLPGRYVGTYVRLRRYLRRCIWRSYLRQAPPTARPLNNFGRPHRPQLAASGL